MKADVSKPAEIDRLFELAVKEFGKIDIVVVNAGLELVGVPVTSFSEDCNLTTCLIPIQRAHSSFYHAGGSEACR